MELQGEVYHNTTELAELFQKIGFTKGASESTLRTWRSKGSKIRGPKYLKIGGAVYYPQSAIDDYLLNIRNSELLG